MDTKNIRNNTWKYTLRTCNIGKQSGCLHLAKVQPKTRSWSTRRWLSLVHTYEHSVLEWCLYGVMVRTNLPYRIRSELWDECQVDGISVHRSTMRSWPIARPPHQPPVILSGTPELGLTPLTCVCWQINSILANIGHRNSIRILNQYPFWWNLLIWA